MIFSNSIKFDKIFSDGSGCTNLYTNFDSINSCIALLLQTSPGELLGQPEWGSGLTELMFNANVDEYADFIKQECANCIEKWETRVTVNKDDILVDFDNVNKIVHITIPYSLRNSKIGTQVSFDFGFGGNQ